MFRINKTGKIQGFATGTGLSITVMPDKAFDDTGILGLNDKDYPPLDKEEAVVKVIDNLKETQGAKTHVIINTKGINTFYLKESIDYILKDSSNIIVIFSGKKDDSLLNDKRIKIKNIISEFDTPKITFIDTTLPIYTESGIQKKLKSVLNVAIGDIVVRINDYDMLYDFKYLIDLLKDKSIGAFRYLVQCFIKQPPHIGWKEARYVIKVKDVNEIDTSAVAENIEYEGYSFAYVGSLSRIRDNLLEKKPDAFPYAMFDSLFNSKFHSPNLPEEAAIFSTDELMPTEIYSIQEEDIQYKDFLRRFPFLFSHPKVDFIIHLKVDDAKLKYFTFLRSFLLNIPKMTTRVIFLVEEGFDTVALDKLKQLVNSYNIGAIVHKIPYSTDFFMAFKFAASLSSVAYFAIVAKPFVFSEFNYWEEKNISELIKESKVIDFKLSKGDIAFTLFPRSLFLASGNILGSTAAALIEEVKIRSLTYGYENISIGGVVASDTD